MAIKFVTVTWKRVACFEACFRSLGVGRGCNSAPAGLLSLARGFSHSNTDPPVFEESLPLPPKRPGNPVSYFVSDFFKQKFMPGAKSDLLMTECAKAWNLLNENKRNFYRAQYQKKREQYLKELAEFNMKYGVKYRRVNGHNVMSKEKCATLPADQRKDYIMYLASVQWNNLERSEKQVYNEMAKIIRESPCKYKSSGMNGFNVMKKEKCAALPVDQRRDYITYRASAEWKSLPTSEKQVYNERARKLRVEINKMRVHQISNKKWLHFWGIKNYPG